MDNIGIGAYIGIIIIVLHLIVGFGYMIYMLTPRKSDKNIPDEEMTEHTHQ